jgi:hypothetical protein
VDSKIGIHLRPLNKINLNYTMKKVLSIALVAGMFAFIACGPSKQETEAAEKAKQDSIAAAMAQDSMAAAAAAASAMVDTAAQMVDTTAAATEVK